MAWSEWEETDLVLAGRTIAAALLSGLAWIGLAIATDGAGNASLVFTIPLFIVGPLAIALLVSAPALRPTAIGITGVVSAYAVPAISVLSRVRQSTADSGSDIALGAVLITVIVGSVGAALPLIVAVVSSLRADQKAPADAVPPA